MPEHQKSQISFLSNFAKECQRIWILNLFTLYPHTQNTKSTFGLAEVQAQQESSWTS